MSYLHRQEALRLHSALGGLLLSEAARSLILATAGHLASGLEFFGSTLQMQSSPAGFEPRASFVR